MTVFDTARRVIVRTLPSLMFSVVFSVAIIVITIAMSSPSPQTSTASATKQVTFAVSDLDRTALSAALIDDLRTHHIETPRPQSEDALRDALFYDRITVIITIPKGFAAALNRADGHVPLMYEDAFGASMSGAIVRHEADRFITAYRLVRRANPGIDDTKALTLTQRVCNQTITTELIDKKSAQIPVTSVIFRIEAYNLLAVCLAFLFNVMKSFRSKAMFERILVGPTPWGRINRQILGAVFGFIALVFVVFVLPIVCLLPNPFHTNTLFLLANLIVFTVSATALAFFTVSLGLAASSSAQGAVVTLVSLLCSFLGGLFIPIDIMPSVLRGVALFTPTYWYNASIVAFENAGSVSPHVLQSGLTNGLVMVAFTVTFFLLHTVIERGRVRRGRLKATTM